MADIKIRKRKRIRTKETKVLAQQLEEAIGVPVFSEDDPVDIAESEGFNVVFVGNEILALIYEDKPFLTVRGILKYKPERNWVTVDMGAVPFVTNGADVMGPGIVDADENITEGDLVWIRDVNHMVPLAVGVACCDTETLRAKQKGKVIKTLHNVGDKLWKSGE